MKAKEVFILNLGQDSKSPDYIVAFTTARSGMAPEEIMERVTKLEYGGRFTLLAYAVKFAQLLKDGAA